MKYSNVPYSVLLPASEGTGQEPLHGAAIMRRFNNNYQLRLRHVRETDTVVGKTIYAYL